MRGTSSSFAETPLFFVASHQFSILLTLKYRLHRDTFSKSSFSPILYHLLISRTKETKGRNRFDSCCKRMPRENGAIARNANDWQDRCNWISDGKGWRDGVNWRDRRGSGPRDRAKTKRRPAGSRRSGRFLSQLDGIFSAAALDGRTYRPERRCRSRRLHCLSGWRIPHSDGDLEAIDR